MVSLQYSCVLPTSLVFRSGNIFKVEESFPFLKFIAEYDVARTMQSNAEANTDLKQLNALNTLKKGDTVQGICSHSLEKKKKTNPQGYAGPSRRW